MGKSNAKKNANTKKATPESNCPPKDVHLGDGVREVATAKVNKETQELASMVIEKLFGYLKATVKDIPDSIMQLLSTPETKKEVAVLWSEQLYERGIVPKGYSGLTDELLIHNFHQDGYLDGMYVGYLISMIALAENGISTDDLLLARKNILPRLVRKRYEDRHELCDELEGKMRKWNEKPSTVDGDN